MKMANRSILHASLGAKRLDLIKVLKLLTKGVEVPEVLAEQAVLVSYNPLKSGTLSLSLGNWQYEGQMRTTLEVPVNLQGAGCVGGDDFTLVHLNGLIAVLASCKSNAITFSLEADYIRIQDGDEVHFIKKDTQEASRRWEIHLPHSESSTFPSQYPLHLPDAVIISSNQLAKVIRHVFDGIYNGKDHPDDSAHYMTVEVLDAGWIRGISTNRYGVQLAEVYQDPYSGQKVARPYIKDGDVLHRFQLSRAQAKQWTKFQQIYKPESVVIFQDSEQTTIMADGLISSQTKPVTQRDRSEFDAAIYKKSSDEPKSFTCQVQVGPFMEALKQTKTDRVMLEIQAAQLTMNLVQGGLTPASYGVQIRAGQGPLELVEVVMHRARLNALVGHFKAHQHVWLTLPYYAPGALYMRAYHTSTDLYYQAVHPTE